MRPIYNNPLLESWGDLEKLDFSEVFMIVDMQPFFISEHSLSPTEKDYYHALKRNIIHKLESVLENKWLIMNIEYLSPYWLRRWTIKSWRTFWPSTIKINLVFIFSLNFTRRPFTWFVKAFPFPHTHLLTYLFS